MPTSRICKRVDVHAISAEGIRIGADPLGGASVDYWGAIGERTAGPEPWSTRS